jgi:hypothetical protein
MIHDMNRELPHRMELSDRATLGDAQATEELRQIEQAEQRTISQLQAINAEDHIRQSVADFQQRQRDSDNAHEMRMAENADRLDAEHYGNQAAAAMSHGESATDALDKAASSLASAERHHDWAERYDPNRNKS